jgi:hypothetical protein
MDENVSEPFARGIDTDTCHLVGLLLECGQGILLSLFATNPADEDEEDA